MEKFWWKIFDGNCWWKIFEEMSYLISLNPLLFKNIAVGEFKTKNKDSLLQLLAHHLSKQHYNRLANLKNLKDANESKLCNQPAISFTRGDTEEPVAKHISEIKLLNLLSMEKSKLS